MLLSVAQFADVITTVEMQSTTRLCHAAVAPLLLLLLLLTGFETTSNALSWTIGSLACHPEALSRLEQVRCASGCG